MRDTRLERGLSIVAVAKACHISKQYLCDIEHGRRGLKMDLREAGKLATCLQIPVELITCRVDKLTDRQARQYNEYHRVLRSNTRAEQALTHMSSLRTLAIELRMSVCGGKDATKLLQRLETVIEMLDSTLAYRSPRAKRWAQVQGDDSKLTPGRRLMDWDKVG